MNPNNCATCDHKRNPDGGWCYMFRDEPTDACAQHTGYRDAITGANPRMTLKLIEGLRRTMK